MEHGIDNTPQDILTSRVYNSNRYHNDKVYARSSKTREITMGESGGKCGLFTKPMSDKGLAVHYTQRNVEREKALFMQWF